MNEDEKRSIVLQVALNYLGTFYSWGGDDPTGFDCSGLVVECLKSIGILNRKTDMTAQNMHDKWLDNKVTIPKAGDLVFWSSATSNKIIHVEIILNDELSIGASGGGSKTRTKQDAIEQGAFIKIRPFKSRPYLRSFLNPYI